MSKAQEIKLLQWGCTPVKSSDCSCIGQLPGAKMCNPLRLPVASLTYCSCVTAKKCFFEGKLLFRGCYFSVSFTLFFLLQEKKVLLQCKMHSQVNFTLQRSKWIELKYIKLRIAEWKTVLSGKIWQIPYCVKILSHPYFFSYFARSMENQCRHLFMCKHKGKKFSTTLMSLN